MILSLLLFGSDMNSCVTHFAFNFLVFWGEIFIETDLDSSLAQILGISEAALSNETCKSR